MIAYLLKAVAASIAQRRLTGPRIVMIWSRISRIGQRFARLVERIKAGRKMDPRPRPPRPGGPPGPTDPLPRRDCWLIQLVPGAWGAAPGAGWLRSLLADPEMLELVGVG